MNDLAIFAAGFTVAMAMVSVVAVPMFASARRSLEEARETIQAQQEDIDSLFEILPMRLPNGRFAKRQENNHG